MAYNPINWKDYPDTSTPLSAENLKHMEEGIVELEKEIENLNIEITEKSAESPMQTVAGNIASLVLEGNSRKSKNLINAENNEYDADGIKITYNDGTYTINGTATKSFGFNIQGAYNKSIGYVLSGDAFFKALDNDVANLTISVYTTDEVRYLNKKTVPQGKTIRNVYLWITSGGTFNNVVIKPMLSYESADFEPYGLIIPSGDVVSHSKNLIVLEQGVWSELPSKTNNATRLRATELIPCKKGDTFTFSSSSTLTNLQLYARFFDSSNNVLGNTTYTNNMTFTVSYDNVAYMTFTLRKSDNSNITVEEVPNAMLEEGSTATDYKPYGYSTVHTDRPLVSINDLKNKLIINADGSGYFEQKLDVVDDLSTLNWKYSTDHFEVAVPSNMKKSQNPLNCIAEFDYTSITTTASYLRIYVDGITDADSFKAYIQNKKIIYEVNEPTTIALSKAEIAELLSLKTYDGTTFIDADGCPFEVGFFVNEAISNLNSKLMNLINISQQVAMASLLGYDYSEDTENS